MGNHDRFIQEIDSLIKEVEQEVQKREYGIPGEGDIRQLMLAIGDLKTIKYEILNNKIPKKEERRLAIAWYIVDSWKSSKLGDELLNISLRYEDDLF